MLKRVIPKIVISEREGCFVSCTTKHFLPSRVVGDPQSQAQIFENNLADELLVIVTEYANRSWQSISSTISRIVESVFMPITIGGVIRDYSDVARVFDLGVERLLVGNLISESPKTVAAISNSYGQQSLVGAVDFWGNEDMNFPKNLEREVLLRAGVFSRIKLLEELGVGEVLLCDVSRDGTRKGSNFEVLKEVRAETTLPIIDSCGFGKTQHFVNSFKSGADAVAVGTYLAFMDQSFIQLKNMISGNGIDLRLQ